MVFKQLPLNSSKVTNSRFLRRTNQIWRRRHYNGQIFTTKESVDLSKLQLRTKNGKLQPYQPATLLLSLHDALQHSPQKDRDAWYLLETIQTKFIAELDDTLTLPKERLFELSVVTLHAFDRVAALRYASIRTQKVSKSITVQRT